MDDIIKASFKGAAAGVVGAAVAQTEAPLAVEYISMLILGGFLGHSLSRTSQSGMITGITMYLVAMGATLVATDQELQQGLGLSEPVASAPAPAPAR